MNKFMARAVTTITGKAGKGLNGEAYAYINEEWVDATTLDSYNLIAAEISRLQADYDGQAYARLRKAKYDLLNQDEMRFDDQENSTTTWADAINAIKLAHPKP